MAFAFSYPIIFCAYRLSTSMPQDNRYALPGIKFRKTYAHTCFELRPHLYGFEYPRKPSPRVTLAEVSFSLLLCKINQPFTSGSRARLGGRDNSGERVVSPRQVG